MTHWHDVPTNYLTLREKVEPHLGALDDARLFTLLRSLGGSHAQLALVGRDKPKIANSKANRTLLADLRRSGIVSTFDEHETPIIVNKKHK